MTLKQIMERINSYNGWVSGFYIETDELTISEADFVLGCCFDENKRKWIVYENGERGMHYELLETDDQKTAFENLLHWIEFENRMNS